MKCGTLAGAPGNYRALWWVALVIMVISRLALVLLIDVKPSSDMGWYYQQAITLSTTGNYAENGVPTAFFPVGYPALLAAVMGLSGASVFVAQIANLALSMVCALLLYRLSLRHFGDRGVASLAVLLLAVYPNHMGYTLGLYSEPLFTALLLLLWLLTTPLEARPWVLITAGIVAGIATLVKAQMLLLAPPLIFVLSLDTWKRPAVLTALRRTLLATFVMLLTIAPWTWRNYAALGAFVVVSTNGGPSLLAGNNPSMTLDLRRDFNDHDPLFAQVGFSVGDQVGADYRARTAAWTWISEHPLRFIALMPKKFIRFWLPDGESEWNIQRGYDEYEKWRIGFRTVRVINQIYYFALLAGLLYGLYHCTRLRDPRTLAAPLLMLSFTALSMVFSGQSRYHAPLMPFVMGYAAWSLVQLRASWSR